MTPTFKLAVQERLQAKLAAHLARCDACAAFNRKVDGDALAGETYWQRWKIVRAYCYIRHEVFQGLAAGVPWGPAHSAACIRHLMERGWPKDQLRDVAQLLLDEENAKG